MFGNIVTLREINLMLRKRKCGQSETSFGRSPKRVRRRYRSQAKFHAQVIAGCMKSILENEDDPWE